AFPVSLDARGPDSPCTRASVDYYLSHTIRLVYQLQAAPADGNGVKYDAFFTELELGTIFTFPFSYRGGDKADTGFVLLGADAGISLAVGVPCAIDYAALDAPAAIVDEELEEEEEELDFALI